MRGLRRFECGQALLEYGALIPGAILVSIVAAAALGPAISSMFQQTYEGVNRVSCEAPSTVTELEGGHTIEVASYVPTDESTTITFKVTSGTQPSISHWVLGLDEATAALVIYASENYEDYQQDPTTGVFGIKFDTGYEGGEGGGDNGGNNGGGNNGGGIGGGNGGGKGNGNAKALTLGEETTETRFIVVTLSGYVDIEELDVTVKAGQEVSYGSVEFPTITDEGC